MKAKFYSMITVALLVFSACSNDDNNSNGGANPVANGFAWKENGGAQKTAAIATFSTQYKTFMVKDDANAPLFEINLNGTAANTYAIGNANAFTYIASTPFYIATGGNVIITSNSGGKVSGTFNTTGSGGGITEIEGTFTNIEVVP